MSKKIVARTKFEKFKRIKPQTLAKMMKNYNLDDEDDRMFDEHDGTFIPKQHHNLFATNEEQKEDRSSDMESVHSNRTTDSVASIFAANAEFYDIMENKKSSPKKFETMSCAPTEDLMQNTSAILLLDLRDPEDYKMAHIKGAINFPSPNIARDKFIKPIWQFKNKEEKIIIIYHEDEKKVIEAAQLLVEKEFQNIYIMTNGYEVFAEENPEFIEGKVAYKANQNLKSSFKPRKQVKPLTECPRF